jgi:phosphatidylserine synthase
MYLLCCAGVWLLIRHDVRTDGQPFIFPGMQILPALAIAAILWLFWLTQPWDKFAKIGTILVGASILYLVRSKFRGHD